MDTYARAQLSGGSIEDLALPTSFVLPDALHLLLLGATPNLDASSSNSSSSNSSNDSGSSSSSGGRLTALPAVPSSAASLTPPSDPPLLDASLASLEYARQLLTFHYQSAASGVRVDPAPHQQPPPPPPTPVPLPLALPAQPEGALYKSTQLPQPPQPPLALLAGSSPFLPPGLLPAQAGHADAGADQGASAGMGTGSGAGGLPRPPGVPVFKPLLQKAAQVCNAAFACIGFSVSMS